MARRRNPVLPEFAAIRAEWEGAGAYAEDVAEALEITPVTLSRIMRGQTGPRVTADPETVRAAIPRAVEIRKQKLRDQIEGLS